MNWLLPMMVISCTVLMIFIINIYFACRGGLNPPENIKRRQLVGRLIFRYNASCRSGNSIELPSDILRVNYILHLDEKYVALLYPDLLCISHRNTILRYSILFFNGYYAENRKKRISFVTTKRIKQ